MKDKPIPQEMYVKDKKIVVYDGYYLDENTDPKVHENVVYYSNNNEIVWKINGAKESGHWLENDTFVRTGIRDNGDLVATNFSGQVFKINLENGKAIYDRFVK